MQDQTGQLPLHGIRVVEFCHVIMGPSCGLVLAELGAEVIKVEPAPGGDRTRALKGHIAGSFVYYNRSKRSIALDLKSDQGRALAHRLVAGADVVTENYAPGTAERLGIGYDTLSALNPRLIYCALKGYLPGPYENRTALDEIVQFNTGLAYMTGPPGRPLRAGASVSDVLGGTFGAVAILAALHQRERTGLGQKVQSGLYEACAYLVGQHMAAEAQTQAPTKPLPVRPRAWGIYDLFETGDGKSAFVGITSDKQWAAFCEHFGRQDLFAQERLATNEGRRGAHDELFAEIQKVFLAYDCRTLIDTLVGLGLPAAEARKPGDLFDDPQLGAGGMSRTRFLNGVEACLPRLPVRFSGSTERMGGQAPACGQDTDDILAGLGVNEAEISRLRAAGVVS